MNPDDCSHPFGSLRIDLGQAGQRGHNVRKYHVECSICEIRVPGVGGIKFLVEQIQEDVAAMWKALRSAGLDRGGCLPSVPAIPGEKLACQHFLGWIKIESAGLQTRGHGGMIWFRCSGCKQKWNMTVGLKVFIDRMREDQLKIKAAIRKLGVEIQ